MFVLFDHLYQVHVPPAQILKTEVKEYQGYRNELTCNKDCVKCMLTFREYIFTHKHVKRVRNKKNIPKKTKEEWKSQWRKEIVNTEGAQD